MQKGKLRLSDFDYRLPLELIAQYPCAKRDEARLLILERAQERISHHRFKDIIDYFSAGDCLVLNNTKVICARMRGRREKVNANTGGGKQEVFLLDTLTPDTYRVLANPAKKLPLGRRIFFDNAQAFATVIADEGKTKVIKFGVNAEAAGPRRCSGKDMRLIWRQFGEVPLPPYIKREPQDLDTQRYQTVYAKEEGATAAPTAGLHFSPGVLADLRAKGVNVVYLTLHISYGTFAAVKCADISEHKMHKEYFNLPKEAAELISSARARGKKIFAVGTTAVRVLETCAAGKKDEQPLLRENSGWTDLFIYPPYSFRMIDHLLTNFHFPKSTLLMLVCAFAGRKLILKAYQQAIKKRYRFFSYGDAMLIL